MYVCMYESPAHTLGIKASWINPFPLPCESVQQRISLFFGGVRGLEGANIHLSELFQHQGEDPEVEDNLGHSGALRRRRAEVKQQHVGEEEEEGEVHDDVAKEHGDGGAPKAAPAAEQETPPDGGAALSDRTSG